MHTHPRAVGHRILSAVALSVLLVLTACSSIGTSSPTQSTIGATQLPGVADGGTLSVAVPLETRHWSPVDQWTTADLQVARAVYDRLLARDENGRVVPELAEKISSSSNHSVWTITLRPDVVFTDGSVLDASVVATNLEAQRNAASNGGLLDPISSVTVVDRSTVTVTMYTPWSTFPEVLTTRVGTIAAPVTLAGFSDGPVGTGPFAYTRTEPDGTVVVAANRSYWRKGLPRLDEVRFVPIADAAERVDA
ncbi:MAG: ABC transporter substrate-binding protein, partial [Acidimicrobiia bacterium]